MRHLKLKKLKVETDNRAYKIIMWNALFPPYWDEGLSPLQRELSSDKARSLKSWKNYRKKQYRSVV